MTTTYIIDKIRQIAIWETGLWLGLDNTGFTEVEQTQRCIESVVFEGKKYPVVVVGNDWRPILRSGDFDFGNVEEVIIPNSVKRIGSKAFSDYTFDCATIGLPESLLEIGDEAFRESKIKKIVIPKNVIYIGQDAFPQEMEVENHSPFLIREDGNNFRSKRYHFQGYPIEFRITDPIQKEVSAYRLTETPDNELFIPDSIHVDGYDYLVTGIDEDFCSELGLNVRLPSRLRKIGHRAIGFLVHLYLPDTIEYIGDDAITEATHPDGKQLHLPKRLRFLGRGNLVDGIKVTSDTPYIDLNRQFVLDDVKTPLFYFGKDLLSSDDNKLINPEVHIDAKGEKWYENYQIDGYDYEEYSRRFQFKESIDSSTF